MSGDADSYMCPVCGFVGLAQPPYNEAGGGSFEICPCCGFEYGFDDQSEGRSFEDYRCSWLAAGAKWFNPDRRPADWHVEAQLANLRA